MLTETFNVFTDTGLTTGFSGVYDLIHQSDESDNPQDFVLYLGSLGSVGLNSADSKIQAVSDPGVDDITISVVYILPEFIVSHAYTLGECVEPISPNGYRYKVTTAGTSASSSPSWPTSIGSTVTSGTCTFTCVSAKHAVTEITLGLSSGDLDTNTPGNPLALDNTILSGTSNKVAIYIRVENNVNTVGNNTATPELALSINNIFESEV